MNQILVVVLLVALIMLEAQLVNSLNCVVGTYPPGFNNAECPPSATYCGLTERISNNGSVRSVGSCQDDVVACDQLCAGAPNCLSACCNDRPNCNYIVGLTTVEVTCMTGTTTNGTLSEKKTCQWSEYCARREVTTDGVTTATGMCSPFKTCNMLCNNFTNCVSACCYDADECNVRPVSVITNIVNCLTKVGGRVYEPNTCPPGYRCGRIEDGNQTVMEVSCQTAAACDAGLCGNRTNCVAACCQNDECNFMSVAELNVGITWTATTTTTTTTTTTPTTTTAATTPTTTTATTTPTTATATTTPTLTRATVATTSFAEQAAQINILMTMGLVGLGWFLI